MKNEDLAYSYGVKLALHPIAEGGLIGLGVGGLYGGLDGAINPAEDETRLQSALKRGLILGGVGGVAGAGISALDNYLHNRSSLEDSKTYWDKRYNKVQEHADLIAKGNNSSGPKMTVIPRDTDNINESLKTVAQRVRESAQRAAEDRYL